MQKIFVANEGFEKEFSRSRAHGHKRLVIGSDVETFKPITMKTDGTDLVMEQAEDNGEGEIYTILCKSFGLVGMDEKCFARVSVILCDNGWMLVTLHEGALIIDIGGKLMMPSVDMDNLPKVATEDILWVDADKFLSYSKYLEVKGSFMYDVEFMFQIAGHVVNGMSHFSFKPYRDMDIDISLGHIAQYEQTQQLKAEAREAQRVRNEMFRQQQDEYEFDEDEDESDDSEDDGDDDWGDYGM